MNENEKEYIKKITIDKAKKLTQYSIALMCISILTYVVPLILGDFDFGIILETTAIICMFVAVSHMQKYDAKRSKKFIITSTILIGLLLTYDAITILTYIPNMLEFVQGGVIIICQEGLTILALHLLFIINKDLTKADNPEKHQTNTDWFYERINEQYKGGNKSV